MSRFRIVVGGRAFDVEVLTDPELEEVEVRVDGQTFTVHVDGSQEALEPVVSDGVAVPAESGPAIELPSAESPSAPAAILRAPLPGVIKGISTREGQRVMVGDELVVIEAMKMDNVIRATREGTIEEVHITDGQRVAHGEAILTYVI